MGRKVHLDPERKDLRECDDRMLSIPFYSDRTFEGTVAIDKDGNLILTVPPRFNVSLIKNIIVRNQYGGLGDVFQMEE